MDIVGYSDRLSVAPDETIRFMVSCKAPAYEAAIVRLIHGDENPSGPGFKEEVVETSVGGEYPGRQQALRSGSYVAIADNPLLRSIGSFTLQTWIYPTTPAKGVQGLLTKWSAPDGPGYGLFLDEGADLALWLGSQAGQIERVRTFKSLRASEWYFVAASYDAERGRVHLRQEPLRRWPQDDSAASVVADVRRGPPGETDSPLLIAGYWKRSSGDAASVHGHFNGKIDSPRLFGSALDGEDIGSLKEGMPPTDLGAAVIAAWDFSEAISTTMVTDISPHNLHGRTVNMPSRAVTGRNWSGNEINFKDAPLEYAAIHFHDDDLEDAGWDVDFELHIPTQLKSGVYAARLWSQGAEDYVPFFVRPKKGTSSAKIVFLVPTLSYLAYANEHVTWVRSDLAALTGVESLEEYVQPQDRYMVEHELISTYDYHTDGSGNCYSSRLRPILTIRPKYRMPLIRSPHEFNADLCLIDWLEAIGFEYEVVTDEDLHSEGASLLSPYRVVLTGTHPEYWSTRMMDGLERYLGEGGRLMYLGGNGFYWVTGVDPERPHVIEVRRGHAGTRTWESPPGENYLSTTGELGGLWRHRGRAPQKIAGIGFSAQGFDVSGFYRRQPGSFDPGAAFVFEGIEDVDVIGDFGLIMGGAAGHELDRVDSALGTPPHTLVLASSVGHSDSYQAVVEEVLCSDSKQGGTVSPLVRADMVYFEGPNGGTVFSTGSIAWCGSLSHNNYENNVSRITENVLRRFASDEP